MTKNGPTFRFHSKIFRQDEEVKKNNFPGEFIGETDSIGSSVRLLHSKVRHRITAKAFDMIF